MKFNCRNYDDINKFLSGVDWISVLKSTEGNNTIYSCLTNIVVEAIEKCYQQKTTFAKLFKEFKTIKKPHIQTNWCRLVHQIFVQRSLYNLQEVHF